MTDVNLFFIIFFKFLHLYEKNKCMQISDILFKKYY